MFTRNFFHKLFNKHMQNCTNFAYDFISSEFVFFLLEDIILPLFLHKFKKHLSPLRQLGSFEIRVALICVVHMVFLLSDILEKTGESSVDRSHNFVLLGLLNSLLDGRRAVRALVAEIRNVVFVEGERALRERLGARRIREVGVDAFLLGRGEVREKLSQWNLQ